MKATTNAKLVMTESCLIIADWYQIINDLYMPTLIWFGAR